MIEFLTRYRRDSRGNLRYDINGNPCPRVMVYPQWVVALLRSCAHGKMAPCLKCRGIGVRLPARRDGSFGMCLECGGLGFVACERKVA